jgi:flagellar basal-body rod modification protein FlgD
MSTITNINANTPTNTATPSSSGSAGQTLTQQDFLKIMVAQFTQQDPLSSGSGGGSSSGTSDYVNQLMSMTNLTTMQTMSKELATSTSQQSVQIAQSLVGSTVDVTGNGGIVAGVVQKARVDTSTNTVYMTIGGQEYSSASLISIDQAAATTPTP